MEMGSMGSGSGGSSNNYFNTESLDGLKFGQKIYFEDAGAGAGAGSGSGSGSGSRVVQTKSGSGSSSSGSGKKIRGGGLVQGAQPPRCQVEGCQVDLSDAKAYYSRHKVCGMHSKSSVVTVAGIQQRFCQQCSRFHQLTEFDQGKRSCRRRLAGHNERRRKPPPGSLFPSRYGRLSSSLNENSNRGGVIMVDFTSYPRNAGRDAWPASRPSERVPNTATGRSIPNSWQGSSENSTSELFLQGSAGGTGFSSAGISPGECFTAVADSSCALSLLSNQTWGSRNQGPGLMATDLVNADGVSVPQPDVPPHGRATVNNYPNTSWGFKGNDAGSSSSSHEMAPNLCLGQMSQPIGSQYSAGLESSQQSTRHYMELEYSRDYDSSTEHTNWSL